VYGESLGRAVYACPELASGVYGGRAEGDSVRASIEQLPKSLSLPFGEGRGGAFPPRGEPAPIFSGAGVGLQKTIA